MATFAPFLIYVVVTTFTPGPNNVLSMTNAARDGYKGTLRFLAGIFTGFWVVMALCGLLNAALVGLLPQVRVWLVYLGAAYMVYLALHIALSKPRQAGEGKADLNTYWAGFTLQFVNLKVIVYGVTAFSVFISRLAPNPWWVALFAPALAGVGFLATSSWAVGGDVFRHFLNRYERWFNLAMAALLIYTAAASLVH
ncbi:MAG: LysE family transporter [Anaerolineaceae bacterium]|nr:LysE family transporter [Anaerolineaceae bacterium]